MDIRDLAPYDMMPFYLPPVQTLVTLSFQATTTIAKPDPMRVLIAFSFFSAAVGTTGAIVGTDPKTIFNGTDGFGWSFGQNTPPLVFNIWDHGALPTREWYGSGAQSMGQKITVITQSLSDWPTSKSGIVRIADSVDAGFRRSPMQVTRAPGVGGKLGILDYWHNLLRRMMGR